MQVFVDDDRGFLAWQQTHPHGYILNSARRPRSDYLILHRRACPHLGRNANLHWTKDYIKICSEQIDDLARWAAHHVTGSPRLTPCQICKP